MAPDLFLITGIIALFAAIPLSSWLDRLIGSGEMGRTKPVLISFVSFAIIGIALGMPWLAAVAMGLAFPLWRTPGFAHNVITPTNDKEAKATWIRHSLWSMGFVGVGFLAGVPLIVLPFMALCFIVFGWRAAQIGKENAKTLTDGIDRNEWAEKARGLALGIAVAVSFVPYIACNQLNKLDETRIDKIIAAFSQKIVDK